MLASVQIESIISTNLSRICLARRSLKTGLGRNWLLPPSRAMKRFGKTHHRCTTMVGFYTLASTLEMVAVFRQKLDRPYCWPTQGNEMRQDDKIAAIRGCYVFADASDQSLSAMATASDIVRYKAGKPLFSAGDAPDGLRVVLSGLVRIWIADPEGRELTLSLMEPGEPFGEIALLDGLPRSANATVVEAGECLLMPGRALETAMDLDPSLARHMVGVLCELLRRNTEALGAFAFLGLGGRLAQKLHDLALGHAESDGTGARFRRHFSQTDLARMLGVSREAVNKRLNALAHDGLITLKDGVLTVPDLSALAARASSETRMSMR